MQNEYLPSKQFIKRFITIIILVAGIFSIYKIIGFIKNKTNPNTEVVVKITENVLNQKDSNDNGIPDWEEALWGLNPKKDGASNKEFILNRRKALNPNGNFSEEEENFTENDILSQQFFTAIMSLQQTGDLDEEAMQAIGGAISQKVAADPLIDEYAINNLKVIGDSVDNNAKYFDNFIKIRNKYADADIGGELVLIIQAIAYNDEDILNSTKSIAISYINFGNDLIKTEVPASISQNHLNLANDYNKVGQSIEEMSEILSNPVVGMKGLLHYKKYSDSLVNDFINLSDVLDL